VEPIGIAIEVRSAETFGARNARDSYDWEFTPVGQTLPSKGPISVTERCAGPASEAHQTQRRGGCSIPDNPLIINDIHCPRPSSTPLTGAGRCIPAWTLHSHDLERVQERGGSTLPSSFQAGDGPMLCIACLGTGEFPGKRTCQRCAGQGDLPDTRLNNPMCPYCIGKGRDRFHKGQLCSVCDGWGRLPSGEDSGPTVDIVHAAPKQPVAETNEPGDPDPLEDVLRSLVGDVEVCDPSLAASSLDSLRLLRRCDLIRVLTHDIDADVLPHIREFTRELPRFLFRRYGGREIRDRYVLTKSEIIFLGPTTEDGNGPPPTLIRVPVEVAGEMIQDVRVGFNRLWSAGNRLG